MRTAGATDEAIADFTMFHDAYLSPNSPGHEAYLTYKGRPVIFIFPKGGHTDWNKVRALVNSWNPAPFLIYENLPGPMRTRSTASTRGSTLGPRAGRRMAAIGASNT